MRITNHMAILRNLRNIVEAGVSEKHMDKVRRALKDPSWARGARHVLPFRFVTAARHAPQFERELDVALKATIGDMAPLEGRTLVLVDVSGSMVQPLSGKSELNRMDAAATLAAIVPGHVHVFSFSDRLVEVPDARGLSGVRNIVGSQPHGGTRLGDAVLRAQAFPHDRIIVITDEQAHPMSAASQWRGNAIPAPVCERAYVINVGSDQNGIGYERWCHIDGFSETTLTYIREVEGKPGQPMEVQLAEDVEEEEEGGA